MGFGFKLRYVDVICDNTLKNTVSENKTTGYSFNIRLGYYRGLFLSCIDKFEIKVDGKTVKDEDVTFSINGKEFCPYQLSDCISEFWLLTEPATIKVSKKDGLEKGEHNIEVTLILRVPYLPIPVEGVERSYMPIDSCEEKKLILQESAA